ncbi:hypothetical protein [Vibrio mimicus]|uniref:hypothetical protein n=1 Tax=Vibrio mimicus TaxID=674 RepID=UPI0008783738|nr:hypothetical protein [Vibrio mimicus]AOW82304.1 hypothetical protein VM_06040 [Vibrio mimicus]
MKYGKQINNITRAFSKEYRLPYFVDHQSRTTIIGTTAPWLLSTLGAKLDKFGYSVIHQFKAAKLQAEATFNQSLISKETLEYISATYGDELTMNDFINIRLDDPKVVGLFPWEIANCCSVYYCTKKDIPRLGMAQDHIYYDPYSDESFGMLIQLRNYYAEQLMETAKTEKQAELMKDLFLKEFDSKVLPLSQVADVQTQFEFENGITITHQDFRNAQEPF